LRLAWRPSRRPPRNFDKWDGCTTKNYAGMGATFTPTWYQVFNGVDLSAPLTYAVGLYGNAPQLSAATRGSATTVSAWRLMSSRNTVLT
jgi:hypothetical protein